MSQTKIIKNGKEVNYDEVDDAIYVSDTYIKINDKGQCSSWSFYITSNINIEERHFEKNYSFTGDCQIHKIMGVVGGAKYPRVSAGKILSESKNIGKKNETNQLIRLIETGNSEINKKLKLGYVKFGEEVKKLTFLLIDENINSAPIPQRFCSKGEPKFPCNASIKYDGISIIFCYHPDFNEKNNVLCYTRGRKKALGFNDLREDIRKTFKNYPGLFIVGEFYEHGKSRNILNSIHSRNISGKLENGNTDFVIFDCFYCIKNEIVNENSEELNSKINEYNTLIEKNNYQYINKYKYDENIKEDYLDIINFINEGNVPIDMKYSERQKLLNSLDLTGHLKLAKNKLIDNQVDLHEFYNEVMEKNYEGLIIHNNDTIYSYSFTTPKINRCSFKMKPFHEDEFKIVNYKTGEGKASKRIIFILETDKGKEFSVDMNIPNNEMEILYEDVINYFDEKYKNKLLSVRYESMSDYDIPVQAKGISLREDL